MSVRLEHIEGWSEVVLDRAERRNALTPGMLDEMARLVRAHDARRRVLLVRGEGRVFCAGFDLSLCRDDASTLDRLLVGLDAAIRAMRSHAMPVVLCAHGAAIAGGAALLGGADTVATDANAKIGYPVLRLGVSPAVSAPFLRLMAGDGATRARTLEPELIDGTRAHAEGLAHALEPDPDSALLRARETARSLAAKPASALIETKRWMNEIDGSARVDGRALGASRSLVGGAEERALLPRAWSREKGTP